MATPAIPDAAPAAFALAGALSPSSDSDHNDTDTGAALESSPKRHKGDGGCSRKSNRPSRKNHATKLELDAHVAPLLDELAETIGTTRVAKLKSDIERELGIGPVWGAFERDAANKLSRYTPTKPLLLEYALSAFAHKVSIPDSGQPYVFEFMGEYKFLNAHGSDYAIRYCGMQNDEQLLSRPTELTALEKELLTATSALEAIPKEAARTIRNTMHSIMQHANGFIKYQAFKAAEADGVDKKAMDVTLHLAAHCLGADVRSKGGGIVCNGIAKPYVQQAINALYETCKRRRCMEDDASDA